METLPHGKALNYILLEILSEHPNGLTPKLVYEFVGADYAFPEEWSLYRPTSAGVEDLKASGIDDWRTLPQHELVTLVDTEPQWHHALRWARVQLKSEGYLDLAAPRGIWRLNEKGLRVASRQRSEAYAPEEIVIIKSRQTLKRASAATSRLKRKEATTPLAYDLDHPAPATVEMVTYRILRDTALARRLKELHAHRCQICGITLPLAAGNYSEAHHLQPLGAPHAGPDIAENILVLCPNHHALCDYGAIKLEIADLRRHPSHKVGVEFIAYHNGNIFRS